MSQCNQDDDITVIDSKDDDRCEIAKVTSPALTNSKSCLQKKSTEIIGPNLAIIGGEKEPEMVATTSNIVSRPMLWHSGPENSNFSTRTSDGGMMLKPESVQELKKSLTLNFASPDSLKKSLATPEILQMLRFTSPDLGKFLTQQAVKLSQQQGGQTPTPTKVFFPTNVTAEQEQYARGFVDALRQLESLRGTCLLDATLLSPGFVTSAIESQEDRTTTMSFDQLVRTLTSSSGWTPTSSVMSSRSISNNNITISANQLSAFGDVIDQVASSASVIRQAKNQEHEPPPGRVIIVKHPSPPVETKNDVPIPVKVKLEGQLPHNVTTVNVVYHPPITTSYTPPPAAGHFVTLSTSIDPPEPKSIDNGTSSLHHPTIKRPRLDDYSNSNGGPTTVTLLNSMQGPSRVLKVQDCIQNHNMSGLQRLAEVSTAMGGGGINRLARPPLQRMDESKAAVMTSSLQLATQRLVESLSASGASASVANHRPIRNKTPPTSDSDSNDDYDEMDQSGMSTITDRSRTSTPGGGMLGPMDPVEQERMKLERKRARNRMAASKCRKRKLEIIGSLSDKVAEIEQQNDNLTRKVNDCKLEVVELKRQLELHRSRGCKI